MGPPTLPPVFAGSAAAQVEIPQLRWDGRWLVDQHGRVVLVHGVNLVWKHAPYVPPNTAEGFTAADARWLAEHGFNGARIGTLWAGATPTAPGVADAGYLNQWDHVVDLLADQRIWMQFDFHQDQWHETYRGEGVPGWAALPLFAGRLAQAGQARSHGSDVLPSVDSCARTLPPDAAT